MTTDALRSPERLRVLVVDDHDVVHWGFRLMLTQQPWVERCISAHSGREALSMAARYRPHVALVDLFIGEESGAEICEQLRAAEPMTRVLLFSGAGEISPRAARAAGASGFAYKDWPAAKIASAVRAVGLGKSVFARQDQLKKAGQKKRVAARLPDTKPSLALAAYAGRYEDETYGPADVALRRAVEWFTGLYSKSTLRYNEAALRRG